MNDTETAIRTLLSMILQARNVNQDGIRFKAEVETHVDDTVHVTYRLEIEVKK